MIHRVEAAQVAVWSSKGSLDPGQTEIWCIFNFPTCGEDENAHLRCLLTCMQKSGPHVSQIKAIKNRVVATGAAGTL